MLFYLFWFKIFFVRQKEKHEGRRVEVLIIDTTKINKIPFLFIANLYLNENFAL